MTLKNTTKIALLMTVLVLPLAVSSAYADGSAEIVSVCGFDAPDDVPLGLLYYGLDGDENNFSIDVTGNGVGTLELEASEWKGTENNGEQATQIVTMAGPFSTQTYYAINAPGFDPVGFDGTAGPTTDDEKFDISSQDTNAIAATLANKIINHAIYGNIVSAYIQNGNEIVLTAKEPGTFWNGISTNSGNGVALSQQPYFVGGTDDFSVLPAETTRYSVTTDGTASDGSTYLDKTPIAPAGQDLVLTTEAFRDNPINLTFQLTGIDVLDDVDYTGAIQQDWTFTYSCTE